MLSEPVTARCNYLLTYPLVNLLRVGPYLLQCLEQGSAQAAVQSTLLQRLTRTWWAAAWLFGRHTAPVCTPRGLSVHGGRGERTQSTLPKATRKSPPSSDEVPALGEGSHMGTHRLGGKQSPRGTEPACSCRAHVLPTTTVAFGQKPNHQGSVKGFRKGTWAFGREWGGCGLADQGR